MYGRDDLAVYLLFYCRVGNSGVFGRFSTKSVTLAEVPWQTINRCKIEGKLVDH
jgi:hypothetical protein